MHNKKRRKKKFFWITIFLLSFLMIPGILSGMEADKTPKENSISQGKYVLKVKENYISLKAKDASLKDILEEIGRRMNIKVFANIPREEKITIDFDMMYLGDAIKRFRTNYAFITASEKEEGKISKIVALPEGNEKAAPGNYEYNPQPPIQEFKQNFQPSDVESGYNPQPSIQKFEQSPYSSTVKSEQDSRPSIHKTEQDSHSFTVKPEQNSHSSSIKPEQNSQISDVESENTPQTPDVESGYNPQPSMQ